MPVISLSCPQCGKPSTEYDENKWQCLTCGSKFVYEKPIQQPSVNLTKVVKRAGESVEKTLLDFGDACKVTNLKVTTDGETFAIANVASLSYQKHLISPDNFKLPRNFIGMILLWVIGFPVWLFSGLGILITAFNGRWFPFLVCGLLFCPITAAGVVVSQATQARACIDNDYEFWRSQSTTES